MRRFCARAADQDTVRRQMDTDLGHDPAVWARLGSELGVLRLAVPEELGGPAAGSSTRRSPRRSSAPR